MNHCFWIGLIKKFNWLWLSLPWLCSSGCWILGGLSWRPKLISILELGVLSLQIFNLLKIRKYCWMEGCGCGVNIPFCQSLDSLSTLFLILSLHFGVFIALKIWVMWLAILLKLMLLLRILATPPSLYFSWHWHLQGSS